MNAGRRPERDSLFSSNSVEWFFSAIKKEIDSFLEKSTRDISKLSDLDISKLRKITDYFEQSEEKLIDEQARTELYNSVIADLNQLWLQFLESKNEKDKQEKRNFFKIFYLHRLCSFIPTVNQQDFSDCDFTSLDLEKTKWTAANFKECEFADAKLNEANLTDCHYTQAFMPRTQFKNAVLQDINFTGAHLCEADFTGASLTNCDFTGANLSGANFEQTKLSNITLIDARLAHMKMDEAVRVELLFFNLEQIANSNLPLADKKIQAKKIFGGLVAPMKDPEQLHNLLIRFEQEKKGYLSFLREERGWWGLFHTHGNTRTWEGIIRAVSGKLQEVINPEKDKLYYVLSQQMVKQNSRW